MVDCIILDDDEDVVMTAKTTAGAKGHIQKESIKFEKRLIALVRKHRIIFDNKHKFFANVERKEIVWQQIAKKLKMDVDICKSTWIKLRHRYQSHIRQLRKYFLCPQKRQHKQRPTMDFENDLIFLFRFIEQTKYCPIPYQIDEPAIEEEMEIGEQMEIPTKELVVKPPVPTNTDDDLILIEQPVELIVIDEDDDTKTNEKVFHITTAMKKLVEQVKRYPELYDTTLPQYSDYSRKSFVWNNIANTLGDKATKLMKSWIIMETRFEWEISRNIQNVDVARYQTELQRLMEFFEPYIMANNNTVYKNSYYLKQGWHEPIDYFKDIYSLISRMKRLPDVISVTDALLDKTEKTDEFFKLWTDLSKYLNNTIGQCETTWLIMRHFYWELMNMRKQNYQLTDKWYFEIIITELYDLVKQHNAMRGQNLNYLASMERPKATMNNGNARSLPMVTLPGTPSLQPQAKLQSPSLQLAKQKAPTVANKAQVSIPSQVQPIPAPLPIISSAVSLAPQTLTTGGSLQIRPINALAAAPANQQNIPIFQKNQTPFTLNNVQQYHNNKGQQWNQTINSTASTATAATTTTTVSNKAPTKLQTHPQLSTMSNTTNKTTITQKRTKVPLMSNNKTKDDLGKNSLPESNNSCNNTQGPLPKISGAVSLLNPNEILIELIASQNGNHLVVHGPPLSEKYNLPMATVAKFIREILAIPLLHNKRHNQPALINSYWEHISKRFNLPTHICRACWNFLLENFAHFPQIAPLKELMKPFVTVLKVWTDSDELFTVFDKNATANGWLAHISRLPEVVECIGTYPVLYKGIGKNSKDSTTEMESLCAWRTIALRFPNINDISSIWTAFKNVFIKYMADLEFGIDNKWPINWWRVLARLKFLVEARYTTNEPFYYIVSNKMVEEIERCAIIEMKKRYGKDETNVDENNTTAIKNSVINEEMLNGNKYNVELNALMTAIEKHPAIFEKADCMQKYEAWVSVAKELQMDVTDCLLAFRRACQKYCTYKKQDPLSRCPLNQKYYKRFDAIFRSVKPMGRTKLNIRTPFELNKSVDNCEPSSSLRKSSSEPTDELIFPERYISDISMSSCESNLVVRNWMYAVGNLSTVFNETFHVKLGRLLRKYVDKNSN